MKYFVSYKLKEIIYIFTFFIFLFLLIYLSKENLYSIKNSIDIFIANVIPSLFPFIFFTEFILNTEILNILTIYFGNILSKLFKVSKNATPAILIGFLCGFPMGAKAVTRLYVEKKLTKSEASSLLLYINNCNPAFLVFTVGIAIFYDIQIGFILLISQYFSSIIFGIMLAKNSILNIILKKRKNLNTFNENSYILEKFVKKEKVSNSRHENLNKNNISFFENINTSMINSFKTLSIIFGFIVLFNLLFNLIRLLLEKINVNTTLVSLISGIFEITTGTINISNTQIAFEYLIPIISFVLGFSGFCILFQIYSIIYKYGFSLKNIIVSKFIQGIMSAAFTYILLKVFDIKKTTYTEVLKNIDITNKDMSISYNLYMQNIKEAYLNSTLLIIAFLCIYMIFKNYTKKK